MITGDTHIYRIGVFGYGDTSLGMLDRMGGVYNFQSINI